MQQPAIQAALDNLVEVIRTALTAEFLEYFRDGEAAPRAKRPKARAKLPKATAAKSAKAPKKKRAARRAA